jgi:hypothetical protein
MIKKRIKKILKLTELIFVRQIWKLVENLYNIITQPFLALKKIVVRDRDKSQIFLISIFFLMPTMLYLVARVVWDYYRYGLIIGGLGKFFLIAVIIQIVVLAYLGYWLWKVIKNK